MKNILSIVLILISGFWLSHEANAQIMYKSIGSDGKITYSNHPPVDGKIEKKLNFNSLPSSEVTPLNKPKSTLDSSVKAPTDGIVLYQAVWCGYCRKAKAYLAEKGITYQEIDVDSDVGKNAFAQVGGGQGIPLLFANGRRVQGFSVEAYDELFASK